MEITEVRVKLVASDHDKLRAFCSITIEDCFVVRDLKIIEGAKGPFVAMPSRKLTDRCPGCGGKNHHRASYCNSCGRRLAEQRARRSGQANHRAKLHADIAHPINSKCREAIQSRVLESYERELARSKEPGYEPMQLDVFEEEYLNDAFGDAPGDTDADRRLANVPRGAAEDFDVLAPREDGEDAPEAARTGSRGGYHVTDRPERVSGDGASALESDRFDRARLRDSAGALGRRRDVPRDDVPVAGGRIGGDDPAERRRRLERELIDADLEPEDNFGAGLFS